jgi:hypothetical protein
MNVDPDPAGAPQTQVDEIGTSDGAVEVAPFVDAKVGGVLKTSKTLGQRRYIEDVSTDIASIFEDVRTVATGVLNIATFGAAVFGLDGKATTIDPTPCGKLYVEYDIIFSNPTDAPPPEDGVSYFMPQQTTWSGTQPLSLNPFGTTEIAAPFQEGDQVNPLKITVQEFDGGSGLGCGVVVGFDHPGSYIAVLRMATTSPWSDLGPTAAIQNGGNFLIPTSEGNAVIEDWTFGSTSLTAVEGEINSSGATLYCVVGITNPLTDFLRLSAFNIDPCTVWLNGATDAGGDNPTGLIVIQISDNALATLRAGAPPNQACPALAVGSGWMHMRQLEKQRRAGQVMTDMRANLALERKKREGAGLSARPKPAIPAADPDAKDSKASDVSKSLPPLKLMRAVVDPDYVTVTPVKMAAAAKSATTATVRDTTTTKIAKP